MTIAGPSRTASDVARAIGERLDGVPLLVMLDVDGTLAPIAPTPSAARVPPATRDVVARLVSLPQVTVVLVSGRGADDAWRLVGVPGVWVIGNHGFELRHPLGDITPDERVREHAPSIQAAVQALQGDLGDIPGVIVENKRWTISVHYRQVSPQAVPRVMQRSAAEAGTRGLRVLEGKKIVELRPPVDVHKGTACLSFASFVGVEPGRGSAIYAGDDRTDEDAFRELRGALPQTVTVRIASPEDRNAGGSDAELMLDSPEEMREVLRWLAERRERSAAASR